MRYAAVVLFFVSLPALLCESDVDIQRSQRTHRVHVEAEASYTRFYEACGYDPLASSTTCDSSLSLLQLTAQSVPTIVDASARTITGQEIVASEIVEIIELEIVEPLQSLVEPNGPESQTIVSESSIPPATDAGRGHALEDVSASSSRSLEALKTKSGTDPLISILVVVILLVVGCIVIGVVAMSVMSDSSRDSYSGFNARNRRARGDNKLDQQSGQHLQQQRLVAQPVPTSLAGKFSPYGAPRMPTGAAQRSPEASMVPPTMQTGSGSSPLVQRVSFGSLGTTTPLGQPPPGSIPHYAGAGGITPGTGSMSMVGQSQPLAPRVPPALCPALVLPHCEAWFAVAYDKLMQGGGSFELFGLSGKPLLRATVDAKSVQVSMTPAKSPTLGSVMVLPNGALEVRGAAGKQYGSLFAGSQPGSYTLVQEGGTQVLSVVFEPASSQLVLYTQGMQNAVAWAARCTESDFFSGIEHLEVRVSPGVDAVLVLCCVLSNVLFGGTQLPATARPAGGAQSPQSSIMLPSM